MFITNRGAIGCYKDSLVVNCREERLNELEKERKLREKLLADAMSPELEKVQQIVIEIQSKLMKTAHNIIDTINKGGKVSSATRLSWRSTLEQLDALGPGNPAIDSTISTLQVISEKDHADISREELVAAKKRAAGALQQLESRSQTQLNAENLWNLISGGESEEALRTLQGLRAKGSDNLSELDAFYDMAVNIGAS